MRKIRPRRRASHEADSTFATQHFFKIRPPMVQSQAVRIDVDPNAQFAVISPIACCRILFLGQRPKPRPHQPKWHEKSVSRQNRDRCDRPCGRILRFLVHSKIRNADRISGSDSANHDGRWVAALIRFRIRNYANKGFDRELARKRLENQESFALLRGHGYRSLIRVKMPRRLWISLGQSQRINADDMDLRKPVSSALIVAIRLRSRRRRHSGILFRR